MNSDTRPLITPKQTILDLTLRRRIHFSTSSTFLLKFIGVATHSRVESDNSTFPSLHMHPKCVLRFSVIVLHYIPRVWSFHSMRRKTCSSRWDQARLSLSHLLYLCVSRKEERIEAQSLIRKKNARQKWRSVSKFLHSWFKAASNVSHFLRR